MKKIIYLLVFVLFLFGCQSKHILDSDELKIVIASDIHYFLKEYYEECDWFEDNIAYGDGKMVTYADEILDAFQSKIEDIKPDFVILTGDLSFNGEKGSHEAFAKRLEILDNDGIHVLVIPGNHDVDNINAKGYGKDDFIDVESVDAQEFKDIYKNLGYDLAYHQHKESLSYSVQVNEQYTFIMMDSTAHELTGTSLDVGGYFTDSSYNWLESELKDIQNQGKKPVVVMHHNLAVHNEMLNNGYTIKDNEKIAELLNEYGVQFVLSGHIHCQSIQQINGIYDIASSSLLDAPLQYGIMTLNQSQMNYQTDSLTISLDSNDYFDMVSRNKFSSSFQVIEDEEVREDMLDVAIKANRYYFTGNIYKHIDELKSLPGYVYYDQEEGEKLSFYQSYLETMMKNTHDNQNLKLTIK